MSCVVDADSQDMNDMEVNRKLGFYEKSTLKITIQYFRLVGF
jgi:hypothetical protein